VLLLVCGATISPLIKQLLANTSANRYGAAELTVGRILQIFTSSFHEQAAGRTPSAPRHPSAAPPPHHGALPSAADGRLTGG